MKPKMEGNKDIWNDDYQSEIVDFDDNEDNTLKDYGTEHKEADEVITKYINDGDKAFREILQMLEHNEPKMEARMIKPFVSEDYKTSIISENLKAEMLKFAIICFSLMAILLIIIITVLLFKRRNSSNYVQCDKSK